MKRELDGWAPPTSLRGGLAKTIAWYRANKAQADAKW
jgi:GDP-L-fucose synthase